MAPGVFLLWIGIAAIIDRRAMSLQFFGTAAIWSSPLWTWQVQTVTFLVLSCHIWCWPAAYIMATNSPAPIRQSDQPLLNRRSDQLIGRIGDPNRTHPRWPRPCSARRYNCGVSLVPILPAGTSGSKVVQVVIETDLDLIVEPAKALRRFKRRPDATDRGSAQGQPRVRPLPQSGRRSYSR
jgi:hypothetical protein